MNKQLKIPAVILASIVLLGMASAQAVNIEPGNVDPETVTPDTDVSDQEFTVMVNNLSTDDETDYIYFEFPDFLEDSVEPNEVDTNVTISEEVELTDYDEDEIDETVMVGLNPESEDDVTGDENMSNTTSANVTLEADVDYSDTFENFNVTVHAVDSQNGENSTNLSVYNEELNDSETNQSNDSVVIGNETENETDPFMDNETDNETFNDTGNMSNETEGDEFNFTDEEENTTAGEEEFNFTDDNQTNPDNQQEGGILRSLFNALANLFSPQDSPNSTPEDSPGEQPGDSPDSPSGV